MYGNYITKKIKTTLQRNLRKYQFVIGDDKTFWIGIDWRSGSCGGKGQLDTCAISLKRQFQKRCIRNQQTRVGLGIMGLSGVGEAGLLLRIKRSMILVDQLTELAITRLTSRLAGKELKKPAWGQWLWSKGLLPITRLINCRKIAAWRWNRPKDATGLGQFAKEGEEGNANATLMALRRRLTLVTWRTELIRTRRFSVARLLNGKVWSEP